jgi:thiosulfate/3-mercaptopyruvate sulfurtransferase
MRRIALLLALVLVGRAHAQLTTGPSLLVTAQWLSQHQHDKDLIILQVGPEGGYQKEHIAGSQWIQLKEISTPFQPGTLSLEMPAEGALRTALEKHGISDRSHVIVVFDSEWVSPSARVLFTLGYAGLSDRAMLLDGGLAAWKKAGYPVTADVPAVTTGRITTHVIPAVIVDNVYVAAHKNAAHARVIDARAPEFFAGAARGEMSPGHIPGATSLPFTSFSDSADHMLPVVQIEAKFRAAGVQPGDTVIAYCHVGQQATVVLLAARLTGHPVRLYDGSFQDWSMRKLPVEGGKP